MLKIRRSLGRLIFNMGIAIPGKTVFLIETAPWSLSSVLLWQYSWIARMGLLTLLIAKEPLKILCLSNLLLSVWYQRHVQGHLQILYWPSLWDMHYIFGLHMNSPFDLCCKENNLFFRSYLQFIAIILYKRTQYPPSLKISPLNVFRCHTSQPRIFNVN